MLQISFKINPEKSKKDIDGVNIGCGQSYFKTRPYMFTYAQELGDCSIVRVNPCFTLIIRSFNDNDVAHDFIRQFQLLEKTPKKDCVLFARVNHENKFMFRGTILNFNKEILQYITTPVDDVAVASKSSTRNQCIICLDQSANCVMYPCGHIILCVGCKQNYEKQYRHCSLCKKEFTVCFRVYLQNH
jgi:hypothetical protein